VGRGLPALPLKSLRTAPGTITTSLVLLARRGLANAERPPGARKMIVLAERLALKLRPLMVSLPPTPIRIGATFVMTGVRAAFFGAARAGSALPSAVAASASKRVRRRRRMPGRYRRSGPLVEPSSRLLDTLTRSEISGDLRPRGFERATEAP
jgi:hypothetical protein